MERKKSHRIINNSFYEVLGDKWYEETAHPIAILRAENRLRNPWISEIIDQQFSKKISFLDIGCGAGFLTNYLSLNGHEVHGLDISQSSIEIGRKQDRTKKVNYRVGSAYSLPYKNESFDAVAAMDLLEHVEEPEKVISEASRVLKKGGLFFFHTFSRNLLSYLLVIKGVDLFVPSAPPNMHVYSLFLNPREVKKLCLNSHMQVEKIIGVKPDFASSSFWKMVFCRKIDENFRFAFTPSLLTGYSGYALKVEKEIP